MEVSLLNCYGLQALSTFLHIPFLCLKRATLEQAGTRDIVCRSSPRQPPHSVPVLHPMTWRALCAPVIYESDDVARTGKSALFV